MNQATQKRKRTLYVRETDVSEIKKHWGNIILSNAMLNYDLYVRCTKTGAINWDSAPVYSGQELIERNNVVILKPDNTRG